MVQESAEESEETTFDQSWLVGSGVLGSMRCMEHRLHYASVGLSFNNQAAHNFPKRGVSDLSLAC